MEVALLLPLICVDVKSEDGVASGALSEEVGPLRMDETLMEMGHPDCWQAF